VQFARDVSVGVAVGEQNGSGPLALGQQLLITHAYSVPADAAERIRDRPDGQPQFLRVLLRRPHALLTTGSENARMRVLLVEDEVKLAELVARGLREEGHATDIATRGADALTLAEADPYDVIVLDIMLPDGLDGFEVCRRLRGTGVRSPVLMLTAREAVEDRVTGLDAGADDYLAKPFAFDELLARLRALTRRAPRERPTILEVGGLSLDPGSHRAWRGDALLDLSVKEFAVLELLMRNPGAVLSREQLLSGAWDISFERRSNIIDVYIRYLREKIDRPFSRNSIETVRGIGYRLRVEE
jgi:two-component system OmpR family response regulator